MAALIFFCPNTGLRVQGWFAEELLDETDTYETVTCTACGQTHIVNPKTGKTLGAEDEE
jgi:hypothetical protein